MNPTSALPKALGDGLTLRAVSSPDDRQRYIDLNAAVTNEGAIAERLLHHHPTTTNADYWLVIDETTGKAVSTTCLIPWRCNLDGVALNVAMLEMVVTDPAYRKRGLVRAQIEHFHTVVAARGFDLSIIQGIPYYYRQYGYGYAVDHTPLTALTTHHIPASRPNAAGRYQIRPATIDDVTDLTRLYDATMAQHQLFVERTAADWRYLLEYKAHPVQLVVEREKGHAVGYFVPAGQGTPVRLYEHALLAYDVGLAVLQWLKGESGGEVQIAGPASDRLVQMARTVGGVGLPGGDQWLWRIPDMGALLTKVIPLFERRLEMHGCAEYSGSLCINLYRQAFVLQINDGQVTVDSIGFVNASLGAVGGDLNIPVDAFIRLLLGYRTLDTLRDAWPDLQINPAMRYLVELLFPPMSAHMLMPY